MSQDGRRPVPEQNQADGDGPESTSNSRVEQWLRSSETGDPEMFHQWRMEQERVHLPPPGLYPGIPDPRLVQYRIPRRGGVEEPTELYYDPRLGLPPTRRRSNVMNVDQVLGGEGSASRTYGMQAPNREHGQPKAGQPAREGRPRLNRAGGDNESCRTAETQVSCTASNLREVVQQIFRDVGVLPTSGAGDQLQKKGHQGPETSVKEVGEPQGLPTRSDEPQGSTTGLDPQVILPSQTPASASLQVVASQPPTASSSLTTLVKPKKLRGFAGGKDESWETYRAHLEIVRRVNAWNEEATLANFAAELSGAALDYFSSLPTRDSGDFTKVMEVMNQRFATLANPQAVRGRLEKLRQKTDQSIEDLAQEVRNLVSVVYQDYPWEQREREAVHAFMRAVVSKEIVQALIQAGPVTSMEQALLVALSVRDLGQVYLNKPKSTPVRMVEGGSDREVTPETEEDEYESEEEGLRMANSGSRYQGRPNNRPGTRPNRNDGYRTRGNCWLCGEGQHFAQDCDYRPSNWPEWLKEGVRNTIREKVVGPPASQPGSTQPVKPATVGPGQQVSSPSTQSQAASPNQAGQPQTGAVVQPSSQTQHNAAAMALRMAGDIVAGLPATGGQGSQQGKPSGKNKKKKNKKKQPVEPVPSNPSPSGDDNKAASQSRQQPQPQKQDEGN